MTVQNRNPIWCTLLVSASYTPSSLHKQCTDARAGLYPPHQQTAPPQWTGPPNFQQHQPQHQLQLHGPRPITLQPPRPVQQQPRQQWHPRGRPWSVHNRRTQQRPHFHPMMQGPWCVKVSTFSCSWLTIFPACVRILDEWRSGSVVNALPAPAFCLRDQDSRSWANWVSPAVGFLIVCMPSPKHPSIRSDCKMLTRTFCNSMCNWYKAIFFT